MSQSPFSALRSRLDTFSLRLSAAYMTIGIAWIIVSDSAVSSDSGDHLFFSVSKGIGYVIVTGIALYALLQRHAETRRHYEEALEASLARTNDIADFLRLNPAPVVEFGASGEVVSANLSAEAAANGDLGSLLPPGIAALLTASRETGEQLRAPDHIAGGRTFRWVVFPVPGSTRVFGYGLDMTETAALESRLREAGRLEALGLLARGIAHDFGNTLTAISLSIATADIEEDGLRLPRESVDGIIAATNQATELVQQLRAFGRQTDSEAHAVDLASEVRGLEPLLRHLVSAKVTLSLQASRMPLPVLIDRGQLGRCLVNLVVNANDAMPAGGTIAIAVDGEPLGEWAHIRVADTGVGMDAEIVRHVFEPFFTTKAERGTGLGLPTVLSIARQCGGDIALQSAPGKGTTFTIELPILRAAAGRSAEG